ncbi:MAG: hypothetical protein R3B12_04180 [Candidatus Saccharimonadales bacterium]
MLNGNNFDELTENDFDALLTALQSALHELLGHRFFKPQLAHADIAAWHPSKNMPCFLTTHIVSNNPQYNGQAGCEQNLRFSEN